MNDAFNKDCRLYIQLHAKNARVKARMDALRERIVPELREGKHSPKDLPYSLILRIRTRSLANWKDALKAELKAWLKLDAKVDERMIEIQSGFASEETEALCVEINKAYASKKLDVHIKKT